MIVAAFQASFGPAHPSTTWGRDLSLTTTNSPCDERSEETRRAHDLALDLNPVGRSMRTFFTSVPTIAVWLVKRSSDELSISFVHRLQSPVSPLNSLTSFSPTAGSSKRREPRSIIFHSSPVLLRIAAPRCMEFGD